MEKQKYFKIRVTPAQSESVQIALFKSGIRWCGGEATIAFAEHSFLFVTRRGISYMPITSFVHFTNFEEPEISFDDFSEMYIK